MMPGGNSGLSDSSDASLSHPLLFRFFLPLRLTGTLVWEGTLHNLQRGTSWLSISFSMSLP